MCTTPLYAPQTDTKLLKGTHFYEKKFFMKNMLTITCVARGVNSRNYIGTGMGW